MDGIIELTSSDDESKEVATVNRVEQPTSLAAAKPNMQIQTNEAATPKEDLEIPKDIDKETKNVKTEVADTTNEPTGAVLKTSFATTSNQQERRVHRRKSQHRTLRTSPDVEFESLSLHNRKANEIKRNMLKGNSLLKKQKAKKISILAAKPISTERIFDAEFEKFLKQDETLNLVRELAAERVRINQILGLNSMPEIKFSLYTKREMLEFQLKERFRQKEIRCKSYKLNEQDAASPK